MKYKKFDNTYIVRLQVGDEICEKLLQLAKEENIRLASISGLGAVNEFTVGVYNTEEKKYYANEFSGVYEVVSLTGTLTRKDDEPYLHAHFAAGDDKGHVVGGHLNREIISATAEIVINVIDGEVGRRFDDETGLNIFDI